MILVGLQLQYDETLIVPTDHEQMASDTPFTHQLCVWLPRAGVYKIVFRVLNSRGILGRFFSPEIYFVKVRVGIEIHVSYSPYTPKMLVSYALRDTRSLLLLRVSSIVERVTEGSF
jgi:hypothetical protein